MAGSKKDCWISSLQMWMFFVTWPVTSLPHGTLLRGSLVVPSSVLTGNRLAHKVLAFQDDTDSLC